MTVVAINTAPRAAAATTLAERNWRMAAIALLSVRLIEGFIYWGGGSRRFIYGPEKLDPSAPTWMANRLQSAMPGALLGTDHLMAFLLHHFWLLYPAVILFSAAELIAGAALMAGLLTRKAELTAGTTSCSKPGIPRRSPGCRRSPSTMTLPITRSRRGLTGSWPRWAPWRPFGCRRSRMFIPLRAGTPH